MEKGKRTKAFKIVRDDKMEIANLYFSFISILNKLDLSDKEISLLSHISIVGNISSVNSVKGFMENFQVSRNYLYNIISRLSKKKLLIKESGKFKINSEIALDFINNDKFIFGTKCLFQSK